MDYKGTIQFPLVAGATLVGLYYAMEYFGKESVNYFVLAYIALGGTAGIKILLQMFVGNMFEAYDQDNVIDISINMIGFELQMTMLDFPCMIVSCLAMLVYVWCKYWLYNNVLAFLFCLNALQTLFIGNFKNGFMLLILLFFYDIFFVFGTDVMLTVAKGIEGPIKLMFPKNYSKALDKPQYSILGLGDIVIPGAFVSMCLRFDILKLVNDNKLADMMVAESKQEGEPNQTTKYLMNLA
jgi:minor histocompatibility antigen H13